MDGDTLLDWRAEGGDSIVGGQELKRTDSNLCSTSQDIHVTSSAPYLATTTTNPVDGTALMATVSTEAMSKPARRNDGLVVILRIPRRLIPDFRRIVDESSKSRELAVAEVNDCDGLTVGANARGTFSKAFTLRHPEIEWVHRGQGRYLPATDVKKEDPPILERRFRNSVRRQASDETPRSSPHVKSEAFDFDAGHSFTRRPSQSGLGRPARKRRALGHETLTDSLSAPPTYGLRRRPSELQTPKTSESRALRLARRARAITSIEKNERTTSLFDNTSDNSDTSDGDEDDDDDDDAMADDDVGINSSSKGPTFNRDYVDAHRDEGPFYHTGNGWYKRGQRKAGTGRKVKNRDSTQRAVTREPDGMLAFDPNESIHGSQLDKFPGVEFHHCGNGWYKAGPSKSGMKSSIIVPMIPASDDEEDEEDEEGVGDGTVSKAHKEAHPEFDWVHRGNGRYKRRVAVVDNASVTPAASSTRRSLAKNDVTYSKEYVDAHPKEKFYHTGNARYKRGIRPTTKTASLDSEDEEEDEAETLYSKDYVDAHPELEFHHRGQGRYKRGPRPVYRPADEDEDDEDGDVEGLVDGDYVKAHPDQTFYHKGQGRWARGMPPPGTSNKVAMRGPGAKERAGRVAEEEGEVGGEKPPGMTALVIKSEGPEKFPHLEWHYRGGGKWGRITKPEWDRRAQGANYTVETVSTYRGKKFKHKFGKGAQAQPARAAAAGGAVRDGDDDGLLVVDNDNDNDNHVAAKPKRKGRFKRGSLQAQQESTKVSSNEHSKAPTPKPRMLTEEEDRLTPADLPGLYADDWSDAESDDDDEVTQLLRENYEPLNDPHKFVKALTKHDPQSRSINSLLLLAENTSRALQQLQDEYLALEKITAPHARIPRKPAKGGRPPVEPAIFEDRKEAELYDYVFDPRRIGFQDPDAQRIVRDAEGRELRKRRNRAGVEIKGTLPGWDFGEGEDLAPKRASRQPNRFSDNVAAPARKKRIIADSDILPDRVATPQMLVNGYQVPVTGRWAGHVPKRIRELREESVVTVRSEGGTESRIRKGRPPGSRNLQKRRDAGIKKGPRKPKVSLTDGYEGGGEDVDGVAGEDEV